MINHSGVEEAKSPSGWNERNPQGRPTRKKVYSSLNGLDLKRVPLKILVIYLVKKGVHVSFTTNRGVPRVHKSHHLSSSPRLRTKTCRSTSFGTRGDDWTTQYLTDGTEPSEWWIFDQTILLWVLKIPSHLGERWSVPRHRYDRSYTNLLRVK